MLVFSYQTRAESQPKKPLLQGSCERCSPRCQSKMVMSFGERRVWDREVQVSILSRNLISVFRQMFTV